MLQYAPLFALLLFASSCSSSDSPTDNNWQVIAARDLPGKREPLYRVRVPDGWRRVDPQEGESLADTMKPLTEFLTDDGIKITVHNFPSSQQEERIPPIAQISRWKRQFDKLDPTDQSASLQSFSGYEGFLFEGYGIMKGDPIGVMGWILQVGVDHYRVLSRSQYHPQMRADVTIKAVGPADTVKRHREEIIAFSRSFELIEEIPEG